MELATPDAVLLDAVMPGPSGFDVCRWIKQDPTRAHVPVLFMTGLADTHHIVEGFASGGVAYVVKPVRIAEVLARLATHVLRFDEPFTWAAFSSALELLSSLRGPHMLRVKGIVNVDGKPVAVQRVQHIFHPRLTLDRWPSVDTGTRLVFITRGTGSAFIRNLLQAVAAAARTALAGG